ncbi:MAG: flagellar biosynthetic protein FliO [Kofleriaceae bacterium]
MRGLLALVVLAAPALAYAQPAAVSFEVADHGDSVEVIAHNVEMKGTPISSVRERLEVPVSGQPVASRERMVDGTVMLVEFDGSSHRVLSVKTKLERPEVKELAGLARATQVGADLHLVFPRHAAIDTAAKPAATTTKPEAASASPIVANPAAKPVAKLEAPPAPALAAPAAPLAAPQPAPAADTRPVPVEKDSLATSPGLYAFGALVTLLACGYVLKKKKKDVTATSTIDVVAQRTLGNKSKVVWLSAGGREMLVAVTQQKVQMLGQWPKATSELPRATSLEQPRTSRRSMTSFQQELAAETEAAEPAPIPSSAVSGILKLRARTSGPLQARAGTMPSLAVHEDVATDDEEADLEWAKEILTATGGRR